MMPESHPNIYIESVLSYYLTPEAIGAWRKIRKLEREVVPKVD